MEEVNKSIANSIKSGQYFIDARKWYFMEYVYPTIERSFFLLIASCLLFCVMALGIFCQTITSEDLRGSYIINLPDTIKQVVHLHTLDPKIKPEQSLNEYMLSYYVMTRESYDFDNIDHQLVALSNVSTTDAFVNFRDYISINNVNSPQFLYQKDHTRTITVQNVKTIDNNHAAVYFTAVVTSQVDNSSESTRWVANISFATSSLEYLLEIRSPRLDFVVTSYAVNQIK